MAEAAKRRKVLIVDDDRIIRTLLKGVLRDECEVVGEAGNGEEALRLCAELSPEVVCLDINMKGVDGLHVLEQIKEKWPAMVVVMISGESTPEAVKQAIGKGAAGFVVKPFSPAKIFAAIERGFAQQG